MDNTWIGFVVVVLAILGSHLSLRHELGDLRDRVGDLRERMANLEGKVDVLIAAFVKPNS